MTARFSRRSLLGAALAGGAAALTGCSTGSSAEVTLRYWNFFTGADGQRMVGLVDAFRAAAPDVRVTDTTLLWGSPYYTKLAMAAAGGRAPDLATLHASRLSTFSTDLLDEWDQDELAARGVSLDEFPAPVRERVVVDGRLMALPLDTHPLVLYYNTDVCGRAGLLGADGRLLPLDGAESFLDAGRRTAEVTGGIGFAVAMSDSLASWMLLWTLYRQLGGDLELPDGGPARADRDALVEALAFVRTLGDGTIASPTLDGPGAPAAFASGQAGFLLLGPWEIATAQQTGIPFSMTQFPAVFGDRPLVRADSHSFVLPSRAVVDPRVRSRAYDMAVSMLRSSLSWSEGGHIPALSQVAQSPEYLALDPQANYRGAAEVAAFDPPGYFSGSGSTLMSQGGQQAQAVATGAATPEQGADALLAWADRQLELGSPL